MPEAEKPLAATKATSLAGKTRRDVPNARRTAHPGRDRPPSPTLAAIRTICAVLTVAPLIRWIIVRQAVAPTDPWRTCCPSCGASIAPHHNLCAVSPMARCTQCRHRVGAPPWTVEALFVAGVVALVASGLRGLPLLAFMWWLAGCEALAIIDVMVHRLPTRLCYGTAGGFIAAVCANAYFTGQWSPAARTAIGAVIAVGAIGLCALAKPGAVRWGDVRYALAIGSAASWVSLLTLYATAMLAALSAAVVGGFLVASRRASIRSHLPQGPFWATAALIAVVIIYRR